MDGAAASSGKAPAPTREVLGDLMLAVARMLSLQTRQNAAQLRLAAALVLVQEGKADEADEVLAQVQSDLEHLTEALGGAGGEIVALFKRFAGEDDA